MGHNDPKLISEMRRRASLGCAESQARLNEGAVAEILEDMDQLRAAFSDAIESERLQLFCLRVIRAAAGGFDEVEGSDGTLAEVATAFLEVVASKAVANG